MGRFFLTVVLGLILCGAVAWHYKLLPWQEDYPNKVVDPIDEGPRQPVEIGNFLFPPKKYPEEPAVVVKGAPLTDSVVIPAHLSIIDKQDVSAQVPGQILFIGEEVPEAALALAGVPPFIVEPFQAAKYLQGSHEVHKLYRELREEQIVRRGQMVALLDPSRALNEVDSKQARVIAADAELKATHALLAEALERVAIHERFPESASKEERRLGKLTVEKTRFDIVAKERAVMVSKIDVDQAQILYQYHQIRNESTSARKIRAIYKKRNEAAKDQEPIMQLYSTDTLRAEGLVEVQYKRRLRQNMAVTIEPTVEQEPQRTLGGHQLAITSVAVSRDPKNPLIVSGSEDKSVLLWKLDQLRPLQRLRCEHPVRVVACSPPDSAKNWCLAGDAGGSIYLWDLDRPQQAPLILKEVHKDAVTALAFSPDGAYFASGGADNLIQLWKTGSKEPLYPFDAEHGVASPHDGPITSLHITPQCRLVSASRDDTLSVWELHERGAKLEHKIHHRAGSVGHLDVSRDGKWMLFDLGKKLQILSVKDGTTVNSLENPQGAIPFEAFAMFSPDAEASLLLTAGAPEGRMQLWRTPTAQSRGFEVRQLVPRQTGAATCAAFFHDAGQAEAGPGSFVVTGSKDGNVYLWPVPNKTEVSQHRITGVPLTLIAGQSDATARQIRVGADVRNTPEPQYPDGRLIPGRPVTIVIE